jgi:hypothetical protein
MQRLRPKSALASAPASDQGADQVAALQAVRGLQRGLVGPGAWLIDGARAHLGRALARALVDHLPHALGVLAGRDRRVVAVAAAARVVLVVAARLLRVLRRRLRGCRHGCLMMGLRTRSMVGWGDGAKSVGRNQKSGGGSLFLV